MEQNDKPFRIGNHIIVKSPGLPYEQTNDDIVITMDPGGAFGSGRHGATRMCIQALENVISEAKFADAWSVLDVGTGTGILAICAVKLGAGPVMAVDIDPAAVTIARQNAALNGISRKLKVIDGDITRCLGSYDVIMANLFTLTLIDIKMELLSRLKPGGHLIMSGIMDHNRDVIEREFLSEKVRLHDMMADDKWVCYVLIREK